MKAVSVLIVLLTLQPLAAQINTANRSVTPQHGSADETGTEFFEKTVRPILIARCYECHSKDAKNVRGGLLLDSRASVLSGGDTGPAVAPGNPEKSLLIGAVNYGELYQMPPKSKLPAAEIAALTKWVALGAPWAEHPATVTGKLGAPFDLQARKATHWAWQPIRMPNPPNVRDSNWPKNDVDRFILAQLESRGLQPAPPADKRTLLRRLNFDLIGLPPSPAEVDAFVRDHSPAAWENAVCRLLNSPHFGERWARHWMDLVRYAETRGHEFDAMIPNAWQYRDYVIRAFNADVPYNQFLIEHIAGDLLPSPRLDSQRSFNESILGTGFWFLGEEVHSPVDIRQDEADRLDNRLDVMTKSFLGVTVGCARCHDHKFDAISQADYYALTGFLLGGSYRQVRFESSEHNRRIATQLNDVQLQANHLLVQIGRALSPHIPQIPQYLKAARAVMLSNLHAGEPRPSNRSIPGNGWQGAGDVTRRFGVETKLLERWVAELVAASADKNHPLHVFGKIANDPRADRGERFEALLAPWREILRTATEANAKRPSIGQTILDYETAGCDAWYADGFAFGLRPVRPGDVILSSRPDRPIASVVQFAAAQTDPAWNALELAPGTERDQGKLGKWDRAGRTIRTRKVTLEQGRLWYRVRGSGRAYAVVDSHLMVDGPLHGQMLLEWRGQPDQWQWVQHDLSSYKGHRVHIELSPRSAKEFLAIARVIEAPKPPPPRHNSLILNVTADAAVNGVDALANSYRDLFAKVIAAMAEGRVAESKESSDIAGIAGWLANHLELFELSNGDAEKRLAEAAVPLISQRSELIGRIATKSHTALAMFDGNGVNEQLLIRGVAKTPGPTIPRRFLEALGGASGAGYGTESGRLQLAGQFVADDNPLTRRVIVNRIWQHLFGRGIVATVDNFGVQGRPPSNPQLLDWLAVKFSTDYGWSVKRLIKLLAMSNAYQMSSVADPRAVALDPENQGLQHMTVRRLEAEAIRDSILAVSGRLDRKPFGPPVPVHLTPFMEGRGRPESGPLDGDGRRSIYVKLRRNFLPSMMLAFDMPIPFTTFGARSVSNVPAQALTLMNDPFVIEQARLWAKRTLMEPGSAKQRVQSMYLTAFARPPDSDEMRTALDFVREQAGRLGVRGEHWLNDEQAWADLAHVLFSAKEFIFVR